MNRSDADAWKEWSRNASPELAAAFQAESFECLRTVRNRFPAAIHPSDHCYGELKHESRLALTALACTLQEAHDAEH